MLSPTPSQASITFESIHPHQPHTKQDSRAPVISYYELLTRPGNDRTQAVALYTLYLVRFIQRKQKLFMSMITSQGASGLKK